MKMKTNKFIKTALALAFMLGLFTINSTKVFAQPCQKFSSASGNDCKDVNFDASTASVVTYNSKATPDKDVITTYVFTGATTGSGNGTGTGSTFNVGTTSINLTASRAGCPDATCSFQITVAPSNDPCATDIEVPTFTFCPNDITLCGTQDVTFEATAIDNCGDVTITYSHAPGSSFAVGTTTVTATATDAKGNLSECSFDVIINPVPKCSITSSTETIYLGYGAQTATLTGADGGTYAWSGTNLSDASGETTVFAPTTGDGYYTTTLTTTNEYNCSSTCDIKICVLDIRAAGGSAKNPKVYICHVPEGNPSNPQTLAISVNAIASHIGNHSGDQLGKCGQVCTSNLNKRSGDVSGSIYTVGETHLVIYPNPSRAVFNFELESNCGAAVNIKIYDFTGKLLIERSNGIANNTLTIDMSEYSTGMYHAEITQGTFRKAVKLTLEY